jgi:deferrochelatase/peroxidase EfeB
MSGCPFSSRRGLLAAAASVLATPTLAGGAGAHAPGPAAPYPGTSATATASGVDGQIPFNGRHQAGIVTPQQTHALLASFDLVADKASEVVGMLQNWTEAAAHMTAGQAVGAASGYPSMPPADSGDALGLGPRRLTLTFGFGPGLFEKDGKDRYRLKSKRPGALVDLPRFNGDQLVPGRTGGDLCIQACANDPAVTFHAVRQLARIAAPNDAANGYGGKRAGAANAYDAKPGTAVLRWIQAGFLPDNPRGQTPRNLMGFKDGTQNPGNPHPAERAGGRLSGNGTFEDVVWVGDEGPDWIQDGSYLVVRLIRIALQHWDNTELDFQEQVIGRRKVSGAPLSGGDEFAPLDLDATDKDGNLVIPENAHVRLGAASANGGARILRRGYSYNNGLALIAERWPPWRQGLEYDAGLVFLAFQRDPRRGFIKIFENMSKLDLLNQFATHVGSGVFACPGGVRPGEYIGQRLFGTVYL